MVEPRRIRLDGIAIDALDLAGLLDRLAEGIAAGRGGLVVTPNLDHLRRTRCDPDWRALLLGAELAVADGVPLLWAARLQGTPLPARLAGIDLVDAIAGRAAAAGWPVHLVGGLPGAAESAARVLVGRHRGLALSGSCCPPPGFEHDPPAMDALRAELAAAAPRIVFVALGSPKQEQVAAQLRRDLPATWFIGIGIAFSVIGGQLSRAPRWMQRAGLEWLHRLAQEPRRLGGRYARCACYGSGLLLRSALRRGRGA